MHHALLCRFGSDGYRPVPAFNPYWDRTVRRHGDGLPLT
jgi:hypothetical protein